MKKRGVKVQSKLDSVVQLLIPPSLVMLLVVTIFELFYRTSSLKIFIDIFDIYVITIFAIDLYYRWQETPQFGPYVRKHYLGIIATIPFNLIFWGIEGLTLIKALRGVRLIARASRFFRLARYARLLRLIRFGARAPRFLRIRKHVKETKIRKVQPHEKELKGTLSFKVILLITINSIMGTGIWFLTSAGAEHAGPASLVSWLVLSVISVYIAMCFSELTAMFPKAGGVYEFAKQTYGRFWSFVIGWTTSIAGSVTIAMLLLGALQYLIPLEYSGWYIPVAIVLILIFNYIAYKGMQTSTVVLVTFALITLSAVLGIIIPGFFNLSVENFDPFFVFPSLNMVLAIFFIAETFFGWESAIFLSAETKNPRKVMPKALIWGTVVIAILAFLLAFTAMGTIPWDTFAQSTAPLRDLGEAHFGIAGKFIFTFLIFVSVIGATAGWIVTAPRLLMALAEDKLFFVQFSKIHPKHKSPYVSIAFQILVVTLLVIIGAGSYETLLHMLIPLILIVYSAVLLAVVVLRFKRPDAQRPYKVPFGKVGPFLTIGFMAFLLIMFIFETHGALDILRVSGSLIVFGVPAYFAIELFYEPKYVTLRKNLAAKLGHYYVGIPLAKRTFNRLVSYVGPFNKNTKIVTYNVPMGGITQHILRKKLHYKHIYIANQSKEELAVFRERLENNEKKHISTILLRSLTLPSEIKKQDVFISFGSLGHVKDIEKHLNEVARRLSPKGKFCFYIKNRLLNMSPNSVHVEDKKKMLALFKKVGLKAEYVTKKRLSKKEIFIYGRK